ncbi:hypothetical protein [Geoalkalibacter sp.]|uniref:hypothetical protein n=1 Tax=Geoalkalibacter sp. TaxID=3041440 RepID=UPI00272E8855|nr:hypothetical protein [Geoalkalibacter sp.]
MKKTLTLMLAGVTAAALLTACKDEAPKPAAAPQTMPGGMAGGMPAGHPPAAQSISGTVVETMNTAGYTYVQVDTGSKLVWAAGPETQVKVGDTVVLAPGQEMYDYRSNSLDRTFDMILFVPGIMVGGESQAAAAAPGMQMPGMQMPSGHPEVGGPKSAEIDFSGLTPIEGGQTVGQIYAQKAELSGKEIQVRGKVVRFSPQIMGKNWIHLQDGTENDGKGDITVTTLAMAQVGDTVVVKGVLGTDKDIAHGQVYEVIIEDAEVVVE